MKTTISMALMLTVGVAGAEPIAAVPTMRDAVTHDQLTKTYQQTSNQNPLASITPAKGPDPSTANPPVDLIARSEIISFAGWITLVPKRAILNLPENYKSRMATDPSAKAVGWTEFYSRNRGWITTVEVTREQAEGNTELGEKLAERVAKSRNLVVATYKGGPISVMPVKEPVATENTENSPS